MIIDGHAHTFGIFSQVRGLMEIMNELSVDKIVLCPGGTKNTNIQPRIPIRESIISTNPTMLFFCKSYSKII